MSMIGYIVLMARYTTTAVLVAPEKFVYACHWFWSRVACHQCRLPPSDAWADGDFTWK